MPIITNFYQRKRWQDRFGDDVTIVPIYNDGRRLFRGPLCDTAVTHYDPKKQWRWMFYRDFCEPKYILTNKNFLSEKITELDMIGIQHLGHDDAGTARILTMSGPPNSLPYDSQIPPRCIVFFAVKNGIILSRLRVHQPLPSTIRRWDERLEWIRRYVFNPTQIHKMKSLR